MILVKRTAANLSAGFAEFELFQKHLQTQWVPHFMHFHIEQMQKYHLARQAYNSKPWYQRLFISPPARPKLRRYTILLNEFYQPTWKQWLKAISSTPEIEIPIPDTDAPEVVFGKAGEQKMIRWLAARLDDHYLASCRLHMKDPRKADIDVIVVGPKGYWYFEVKSWKGNIEGTGENDWIHTTKYGTIKTKKSPIWVWKKVSGEISKVLHPMWDNPLAQTSLMKAGGGIAFTVDPTECQLNIKGRSTVKWGHLSPYWDAQLQTAPISKGGYTHLDI